MFSNPRITGTEFFWRDLKTFYKFSSQNYICLHLLRGRINRFFFLSGFSFTDTDDSQNSRGSERTIFYSTLPLPFRHFFATLHMNRLSHIFNCATCIYQTATGWDLPPSWITIWFIDDVKLVFVCLLLDDLILGFCYSNLDMGTISRARIDYHPCITREPSNQVC